MITVHVQSLSAIKKSKIKKVIIIHFPDIRGRTGGLLHYKKLLSKHSFFADETC